MVVTFSFLAAAFYFTYRPKQATAGAGCGCCATEDVEEVAGHPSSATKKRFNMMAWNQVMLWGVTVMAVAFLLFPNYVGVLLGNEGNHVTKNMNRSTFAIAGMTCEGCSTIVAQAIRGVPGVLAAEVSYEKRQAVVGSAADQAVPQAAVLQAIEAVGYTAQPTRRE